MGQLSHSNMVSLLITDEHLRLCAIHIQRLHQPIGSHSGATGPLTGIHYQYSHRLSIWKTKIMQFDKKNKKNDKLLIVHVHNSLIYIKKSGFLHKNDYKSIV
jgi:hypothetical protein